MRLHKSIHALALGALPLLAAAPAAAAGGLSDELAGPVQLQAGGEPIDVGGIGYAAPFYGDFDDDGVRDLLVGEFRYGRLRIFKNHGTNSEPVFKDYVFFQDDAETGRVPSG